MIENDAHFIVYSAIEYVHMLHKRMMHKTSVTMHSYIRAFIVAETCSRPMKGLDCKQVKVRSLLVGLMLTMKTMG